MTLICLIGRHGSGKSTLGDALVERGFKHISVGLLRRIATSGSIPADIPATLMAAMRRTMPGAPLQNDVAAKLLKYAMSFERCVLDGFPANAVHVDMLPPAAIIAVVWAPKQTRQSRLESRALTSKRQWTPGRASAREDNLATVIMHARSVRRAVFLANRVDGIDDVQKSLLNSLTS